MPKNETSSLSNLVAQHLKSLRRLKNRSTLFRSRYRVLSNQRKRTRFDLGGITALAFRLRMKLINASESYALSAMTAFGRRSASNVSACVTSASLPGVNRTRAGRPLRSTAACTFVVGPPRLCPMDCGPFFFRGPVRSAMAADEGTILAYGSEARPGGEHLKNTLPNPATTPVHVSDIRRVPIAIARRKVSPRHPNAKPVQDGVDEAAGVGGMALLSLAAWAKRFDPLPFLIRQLETSHRLASLSLSDRSATTIFKRLTTRYLNRP